MFERIRELRKKHGWSQAKIAKELGCSQQVYSNYELEQREIPIRLLIQLSELYGVSVDYILGLTDCPERNMGKKD